jgi:hypothetical protein
VYDYSLRENNNSPSLNDCLDSTPPNVNKITDVLMRFRQHKYGITSDIENAFLQVQLPKKHKFIDLITEDAHWEFLHAGVSQVIQKIRQRYWIPFIHTSVNYIVRKCVKCRKIFGKACNPPGSPLPGDRVQDLVPFNVTGIDFAGPLQVKD